MGKYIYIYIIFYLFILLIFFSSLISLEFRDAFFRKVECKACTDEVRLMSAISIFPAFTGSSFQIWGKGWFLVISLVRELIFVSLRGEIIKAYFLPLFYFLPRIVIKNRENFETIFI